MPIVCGNCHVDVVSGTNSINGELENVELNAGKCECEAGPVTSVFVTACTSCGKQLKRECFHLSGMDFAHHIFVRAMKAHDEIESSNMTLAKLWKRLAESADAVHAYLYRDHEEPGIGLRETPAAVIARALGSMTSMFPPEMMSIMGPAIASMAQSMMSPGPRCEPREEQEKFDVGGVAPLTREEAFAKCVELGVTPGDVVSADFVVREQGAGGALAKLCEAAGLMLVYQPETNDYLVCNELQRCPDCNSGGSMHGVGCPRQGCPECKCAYGIHGITCSHAPQPPVQ